MKIIHCCTDFMIQSEFGGTLNYHDNNNNNNNFITLRSHECGINEEYTDI